MRFFRKNKALYYSVGMHLTIVIFAAVKPYFSSEVKKFERVIRVDIVALPDKAQNDFKIKSTAVEEKKAVEKQKDKVVVEKKQEIVKEKKKEQKVVAPVVSEEEALEKLKKLKSEKNKKEKVLKQKLLTVKGNRVSKGSDLVGVEKVEYTNYKKVIHRAVAEEWDLPRWLLEGNLQAVAEIKIDKEGHVTSLVLVKSSGNSIYDEKVKEAIGEASPFPPPPEKFKSIVLYEGVTLTFP